MLFAVRISLPDSPGMLGAVATALSHGGANIITLDVVHRGEGRAIDDLCVEAADGLTDALMRVVADAPDARVEAVRPIDAFPNALRPMELAAELTEQPDSALETLVLHVPGALWASWCVAFVVVAEGLAAVASSPCSPAIGKVRAPWLPLEGPTRLDPGSWMPAPWRMGKLTYEMAAAPLVDDVTLLVARRHGPRFRPSELRELGLLGRIASASKHRSRSGDISAVSAAAG